jgi:hypothetical protein
MLKKISFTEDFFNFWYILPVLIFCAKLGSVEYVEAHGTGTKADPEELKAIADVFCTHWFC